MATFHVRSTSFPSSSHPLTTSVEDQLSKLKASQSLCHRLAGLKNLYDNVDDFLQLPHIERTLFHQRDSKCVEAVLDGSLKLLDMCSTTRDLFSQMKECMQELELSLRKRRAGELCFTREVDAYMASRKNISKAIYKYLRILKRMEKDSLRKSPNLMTVFTMLRQVKEISTAVFESLLSFISQHKASSGNGWSLVSQFLQPWSRQCKGEVDANEVRKKDAELLVLKSTKDASPAQVQKVLKGLEALESNTQLSREGVGVCL